MLPLTLTLITPYYRNSIIALPITLDSREDIFVELDNSRRLVKCALQSKNAVCLDLQVVAVVVTLPRMVGVGGGGRNLSDESRKTHM